ncbi:Fe(3+) dicitrate transport protein FecA [Klebsiella pneumoniae]|nr:Fe(3+) dicitrate transport protein FecA [Klebsiella pneumoniae]
MRFEHIESYQNNAIKGTHEEVSYNAPLPALNVLYHLTDSWNLYANTEGSFGTVQYSQIGKAVQSGNVEPEKARTWELGTRYDDGALTAEMGLFLINFNNQYDSTRPTTPSLHVANAPYRAGNAGTLRPGYANANA